MPVSDIVRSNSLAIMELVPLDLRSLVKVSDTETGTILIEWESRKGFVIIEVGVRSYNLTYVPDNTIEDTQWGTSGSMSQLNALRSKISGVMPSFDKMRVQMATVILFKPNGRYYTEESWPVPAGAEGPWDMKKSISFRRIEGGPVLVETQEPWGFPHLL